MGLYRSTLHYRPSRKDEALIRIRLKELAQRRRRFGCPRLHVMLKREGLVVNHKRTERIYREEGLMLSKRRQSRKRGALQRIEMPMAARVNQRWSMDLMSDSLNSGRRFRVLTVVDDYSRECPVLEVDTSITGRRVVRVLEQLAGQRGLPAIITVDNGPEFAGKALDEWAYRQGVALRFIEPGKPVENAYIESFNGKFRDECLNENWFTSLYEARTIIEDWRRDYNEERPHSALGGLPPGKFAKQIEISAARECFTLY